MKHLSENDCFFLQYLEFNIRLRQNPLSHDCITNKIIYLGNTEGQTQSEFNLKWLKSKIPILARILIHFYEEQKLQDS